MADAVKDYLVLDIETCPVDFEAYEALDEDKKTTLLNPIDSRTVAIGIRYRGGDFIFSDEDEKELLEGFWLKWKDIMRGGSFVKIVGFNIKGFDLPFIVTRSFIHNVGIFPFILKSVIDIREKISAYHYGKTRGRLKEFGAFMGIETMDVDGSDVFELCKNNDMEKLVEYLKNDLLITDEMFKRIRDTRILYIDRW